MLFSCISEFLQENGGIFVQGRWQPTQSQLIHIYSVDWADVYETHNIEHRTEPVSHESISEQLILPQSLWLSINSGVIANSNHDW